MIPCAESDSLCWNKQGSLVWRDSHQKRANPKNWFSAHRKPTLTLKENAEWRLQDFLLDKKQKSSQQAFLSKAASTVGKYLNLFTCKPWEGLPSYSQILPVHATKLNNFIRQASQSELRPGTGCARTWVMGGNLGEKNFALGLVLHLVITSLYVGPVILCVCIYLNIIRNRDIYIFLANTWSLST